MDIMKTIVALPKWWMGQSRARQLALMGVGLYGGARLARGAAQTSRLGLDMHKRRIGHTAYGKARQRRNMQLYGGM
jgi:hypothetical protein